MTFVGLSVYGLRAMEKKASGAKKPTYKKTSLSVEESVWLRAWHHKLAAKKDLGQLVTEALDEYLKKRGA